jgi:hypothetical protein
VSHEVAGIGERRGREGGWCGELHESSSLRSRSFLPFSASEAGSAAEHREDRFLLSHLRLDDRVLGEGTPRRSSNLGPYDVARIRKEYAR